jgi:hypothetical protein
LILVLTSYSQEKIPVVCNVDAIDLAADKTIETIRSTLPLIYPALFLSEINAKSIFTNRFPFSLAMWFGVIIV